MFVCFFGRWGRLLHREASDALEPKRGYDDHDDAPENVEHRVGRGGTLRQHLNPGDNLRISLDF